MVDASNDGRKYSCYSLVGKPLKKITTYKHTEPLFRERMLDMLVGYVTRAHIDVSPV